MPNTYKYNTKGENEIRKLMLALRLGSHGPLSKLGNVRKTRETRETQKRPRKKLSGGPPGTWTGRNANGFPISERFETRVDQGVKKWQQILKNQKAKSRPKPLSTSRSNLSERIRQYLTATEKKEKKSPTTHNSPFKSNRNVSERILLFSR